MEQYQKKELVGEGSYGSVYMAEDLSNGNIVAIKKTIHSMKDSGISCNSLREISVLRSLKHANILEVLNCFVWEESLMMVFEYCSFDLKKKIDSTTGPMDTSLVKSYLHQILQGLNFCHSRGIMHRDLKPENLLVNSNGSVKIADFGLARGYSIPHRTLTHEVVTRWYRAPEILLGSSKYSASIDIWSTGLIFVEMLTKIPLFRGNCEIDQIFKIFIGKGTPNDEEWPNISKLPDFNEAFPKWPKRSIAATLNLRPRIGDEGIQLLEDMMQYNPAGRILARNAINHSYFAVNDSIAPRANSGPGGECYPPCN